MTEPSFQVAAPRSTPVANPLFEYLLRLGDDRLVLGHRLSEWCGHGPILEEDIALSNMALDLIGHASSLLALAGEIEGQAGVKLFEVGGAFPKHPTALFAIACPSPDDVEL